jgi:hypothetical protein
VSDLDRVVDRLVADRPRLHPQDAAGDWTMPPGPLKMIGRHLRPDARTLEVGCGASTVVFAAGGTRHTAVSADLDEHDLVRAYLERSGIQHERVQFVAGLSDDVLPGLDREVPLDVALVDGAHTFPFPVVDWHYVSRRLRVGGVLILDDVPTPAVTVVATHMRRDPAWRLLETAGSRSAAFRKLREEDAGKPWRDQAFNRSYPDYSFLGRWQGPAKLLRHRLYEARLGLRRRLGKA